jgi:hypothetical protein
MRSTVQAVSVLVIHPSIRVPEQCAVCELWGIARLAEFFGQWDDACGPDNYIGLCETCVKSGFPGTIGTLEEFKTCQLRALGKAEYEIYGNTNAQSGTQYECLSRPDACARIRKMIARGISIRAVYQRNMNTGRLVKLNQDDQARLVIEAMNNV